ncbi:MAG: hypothetical protein ABIP19_12040 [Dermatophilaceae bacterium]
MNTDDTGTRTDSIPASSEGPTPAPRRPGQTLACGWCGAKILLPARGRPPKWCSSSCRHRAWELTRAAASGLAAIQVVDRVVEVDRLVTVVQEVPVPTVPQGAAWPAALTQLATALDTGRVYDRDLSALAQALAGVAEALDRRPGWRLRPR